MKLGKTHIMLLRSASPCGLIKSPNNKFQVRYAFETLRKAGFIEYTVRNGIAGNYITDQGKIVLGI